MTTAICDAHTAPVPVEKRDAELVKELWIPDQLVRGEDSDFLEHVRPLVKDRSVTLDLSAVERIDAAGIAALVTLYSNACLAGHRFSLTNVSARVAQILSVVGLDRYLLSQNTVLNSQCEPCIERPAA
jgi:anti-anti-sigma factor